MTFAELLALPGVVERSVLAGPVGFLAFHGGLEAGTEAVAAAAAEATGGSLYTVVQPPDVRWHVPSHRVASPALEEFLAGIEVAVAIHGYGRRDRPRDLLVGGCDRERAASLAAGLRRHLPGWVVVDDLENVPTAVRGLHPANPVNRCRAGGVQLELPPRIRTMPPDPALVAALVEVASTWELVLSAD